MQSIVYVNKCCYKIIIIKKIYIYIFFSKIVPYWMYFGQGQDFQLTKKLSEKVQYSRNQAIKNSLNEAILLMSINEALLSR